MRKIILPVLLISIGLFSCNKHQEDLSGLSMGQNFYPTQIGKYIVYDYDSIIYDDVHRSAIPATGQVRYQVADTFRDASGNLTYTIAIQRRKNSTDPFVSNDVISVTPTDEHVVVTEKNIPFIKMIFPVSNGASWNGNALVPVDASDPTLSEFTDSQWNYTYTNYNVDFQPEAKLYSHTVTVNQINDSVGNPDLDSTMYASKNYSQEIYGYNVGMIYRERTYWTFQPREGGGSGYRKGYSVIMKAVDNN